MNPPSTGIADLGDLGLDQGGTLIVKRALSRLAPGERLAVAGHAHALQVQLRAWCREQGHVWAEAPVESARPPEPPSGAPIAGYLCAGATSRWNGAQPAGGTPGTSGDLIVDAPPQAWGLARRGAWVEAGGPSFHFPLATKDEVWADDAARIYAQAAAAQWNPGTAVDWQAKIDHPREIEEAVVQIMTYLVENETAALLVPALDRERQALSEAGVPFGMAPQVGDPKRHVTRLIQIGEPRDLAGDRIGRMVVQELEERQEGPFSKHR